MNPEQKIVLYVERFKSCM